MFTTIRNSHHAPFERQATALFPRKLRQKLAALYQQCIYESKPVSRQEISGRHYRAKAASGYMGQAAISSWKSWRNSVL